MSLRQTRREFLRQAAAGVGFWAAGRAFGQEGAAGRIGVAVIGVGNQGGWNLESVSKVPGVEIVALCDVDEKLAEKARSQFPRAKFYVDLRRVFDQKDVDAVLIATPDHMHAPATMLALDAGKHVYCEKPLTHTVYEARLVAETAARKKVATQMGTQIHAGSNYRRVVELVRSGAIGDVNEVHVWVGRDSWVADARPVPTPAVPNTLHWDLWQGVAKHRPYSPAYAPAKWRGWWEYGGGSLGDMGCHFMDLAHWALDLQHPVTVEAQGPPVDAESAPAWLRVMYEYPARDRQPPVKLTWYHGDRRPDCVKDASVPAWGEAVLFVGSKCMLISDYRRHLILLGPDAKDFRRPAPSIAESIGHHHEWIRACREGGTTTCNFRYSGALTEAVLLGNVAYRTGRKLEWDAKALKATNAPEATQYLRPEYCNGWELRTI